MSRNSAVRFRFQDHQLMGEYFLGSVKGKGGRTDSGSSERLAMEIAQIEWRCRNLARVEPVGGMKYSTHDGLDDNHWDLVEIVQVCIELQKFGKLETILEYLYAMRKEALEQAGEHVREKLERERQRIKDGKESTYEKLAVLEELGIPK